MNTCARVFLDDCEQILYQKDMLKDVRQLPTAFTHAPQVLLFGSDIECAFAPDAVAASCELTTASRHEVHIHSSIADESKNSSPNVDAHMCTRYRHICPYEETNDMAQSPANWKQIFRARILEMDTLSWTRTYIRNNPQKYIILQPHTHGHYARPERAFGNCCSRSVFAALVVGDYSIR